MDEIELRRYDLQEELIYALLSEDEEWVKRFFSDLRNLDDY
jgi:hypothetical protein